VKINPHCRKTGTKANRHKGVTVAGSQNVEIAKKGYEAYGAGDVETEFFKVDESSGC
jgi:hypothetical protein